MRVSTVLAHQIGVRTMTSQEGKMLHTMEQLASGRRVLSPADDPLAASQAVNVAQAESLNLRHGTNRGIAEQSLYLQEHTLTEVATLLQNVATRVVEAGNGTMSDADRKTLANVLAEMRETLLGLANTTDGNGQYLFSGDMGNVQPFIADTAAGDVVYRGNEGARLIQVAQTRQMASADHGVDIFMRASPGSQSYVAQAARGNQGTATFGKVEVVSGSDPDFGKDFTLSYTADASGALEYVITDPTDPGAPPLQRGPYVAGANVVIAGITLDISGEPLAGDSFDLRYTGNLDADSFNVFNTLDNIIAALNNANQGDVVAMASLSNELATANRKVNLHLDNVLTVRASVGARLNEIDALNDEGANRHLGYRQQLSSLEDLDYYAASAAIAMQTMALQAAELAYLKTQNLNLFNRNS